MAKRKETSFASLFYGAAQLSALSFLMRTSAKIMACDQCQVKSNNITKDTVDTKYHMENFSRDTLATWVLSLLLSPFFYQLNYTVMSHN